MLIMTDKGLFCPAGGFYIDPKGAVEKAIITHAHSDHARKGSKQYYCTTTGVSLLKARLGQNIVVTHFPYRQPFSLNNVNISFHPAGHILGSSQVRLEFASEVWVVSGDYKREEDFTCEPFETIQCDVFVTEATFGTPAFAWDKNADVGEEIYNWWSHNAEENIHSVLFAYSLGKTQRILNLLADRTNKPIICHPTATLLNECYRAENIALAPTICLSQLPADKKLKGELFIMPRSFLQTEQAKLLGNHYRTAFASGWMAQSQRNFDHKFVLSDHADWPDLLQTILATKAQRVYVQHRGSGALVRKLKSLGLNAFSDDELFLKGPLQLALL